MNTVNYAVDHNDVIEIRSSNVVYHADNLNDTEIFKVVRNYENSWEGWTPEFFLHTLR